MFQNRTNRIVVYSALIMAAIFTMNSFTDAQQRPRSVIDRKTNPGKGFWENKRAARNIRHSQDFARDLNGYSRDVEVLNSEITKSESEKLSECLKSAKKELDTVAIKFKDDKEVQTALEKINNQITQADKIHEKLHDECCKPKPDGGNIMHCCNEISDKLEKAAADHKTLMNKLYPSKGSSQPLSKNENAKVKPAKQ